jgi:hypothetical protein
VTTDTGSAKQDFLYQLKSLIRVYSTKTGRIFCQFIAECQSDPQFAKMFRQRFLGPRRAAVRVIWQRGVARGEINPDLDVEMVLDMIYAPMVYRLLTGHAPFTDVEADQLIDAVFAGISAHKTREHA